MNIVDYVLGALDVRLYPTQLFMLKLMYGVPLSTQARIEFTHPLTDVRRSYTEPEYLRFLYDEGRCNIAEQNGPRGTTVMAMGRRAGKTLLLGVTAAYAAHRLVEMNDPQARYGFPACTTIAIRTIAPSFDAAKINHYEVGRYVRRDPVAGVFVEAVGKNYLTVRTPADVQRRGIVPGMGPYIDESTPSSRISIRSHAAGQHRLHGYHVFHAGFDELAYMQDAREHYMAVSPTQAAFFQRGENNVPIGPIEATCLVASTHSGRDTYFYELYQRGFQYPEVQLLSLQIPTWEINPTLPADFYRAERDRDPKGFYMDYGAYSYEAA